MAAKLKDLINININRDSISIQGVKIPVIFTMEAFAYVEEAYGASYVQYEKDLNKLLKAGQVSVGKKELKIINALIYGMVRAGGTETTPEELESAIPLSDKPAIFQSVLNIFNNQIFQASDVHKIASIPSKSKKKHRHQKRR